MSQPIDNLEIQVTVQADKAVSALKNLSGQLSSLSKRLGTLQTGGLSTLSKGIQELSDAASSVDSSDIDKIDKFTKSISSLSKVNTNGLGEIAKKFTPLISPMTRLNEVRFDGTSIDNFVNSVAKLSHTNFSSLNSGDFKNLGRSIKSMVQELADTPAVESSVSSLINSVAQLTKTMSSTMVTTDSFKKLGTSLKKFITTIGSAGGVSESTIGLTSAIATLASAGGSISQAASGLNTFANSLKSAITTLSTAPEVSASVVSITNALGNLASKGKSSINITSGLSSEFRSLGASVKKILPSMGKIKDAIQGVQSKISSLKNDVLSLYVKIQTLKAAFTTLWKTVESSMDYVEVLNYFNAAWGQVADSADLSQFRQLGYNSAEEYYDSFSRRSEQLTQKMTGFGVSNSGMLVSTRTKNLGINPSELMNYQAVFGQMSSSMGIASENALKMSTVLTEIGADLASVKNMDFNKVWEDMSSGITGMSRTVDKYGTNIRVANMQQELYNLGINESVSNLGQQDKALLRTIMILDSTRYAWGDLSDTINQPANQLRLLKANFSNLGRTIGSIFLPIVASALPYINAMTVALQRLAESIVKFFGFENFDWGGLGGGVSSDILSNVYDDADTASESLSDAATSAQELKNELMGFDKINKLSDVTDTDTSGNGSSGSGNGSSTAISDAFNSIADEYQKAWDKAFEGMEQKTNKLADKMVAAFVKAWKTGDFSSIGKYISKKMTKTLKKINWKSAYKAAAGFGKGLATFLNGLISPDLFGAIGNTVVNSLNTVLHELDGFGTNFDWTNFGISLGTGINNTLMGIDWKLALKDAETYGTGIADALNGFLVTTDFSTVGSTVANTLNTAIQFALSLGTEFDFEQLGTDIADGINGFFSDFDFKKLAKTINKWVKGIRKTVTKALKKINWGQVLKSGLDFLSELSLESIAITVGAFTWWHGGKELTEDVAKMILMSKLGIENDQEWTSFTTSVSAKVGLTIAVAIAAFKFGSWLYEHSDTIQSFSEGVVAWMTKDGDELSIPRTLAVTFAGLTISFLGGSIAEKIRKAIVGKITVKSVGTPIATAIGTSVKGALSSLGGIGSFLTADIGTLLGSGTLATIGATLGTALVGAIVAAIGGWEIGSWLNENTKVGEWTYTAIEFYGDLIKKWLNGEDDDGNEHSAVPEGSMAEKAKEIGKNAGESLVDGLRTGTKDELYSDETKKLYGKTLKENISELVNGGGSFEKTFIESGKLTTRGVKNGTKDELNSPLIQNYYKKDFPDTVEKQIDDNGNLLGHFNTIGSKIAKGTQQGVEKEINSSSSKTYYGKNLPISIKKLINDNDTFRSKFNSTGEKIVKGTEDGTSSELSSSSTKTFYGKNLPISIKKLINDNDTFRSKFGIIGSRITRGIKQGTKDETNSDSTKTFYGVTFPNKIKSSIGTIDTSSKGRAITAGLKIGSENEWNKNGYKYFSDLHNTVLSSVSTGMEDAGTSAGNLFVKGFTSVKIPSLHVSPANTLSENMLLESTSSGFEEKWGLNFSYYASGGLPESGQLFMARENGVNEMVGAIGNRSAVANNDQITTAIADAIYPAVYNAVANAMSKSGRGQNVNVVLEGDAKGLFRAVKKESENYTLQTGSAAFI